MAPASTSSLAIVLIESPVTRKITHMDNLSHSMCKNFFRIAEFP